MGMVACDIPFAPEPLPPSARVPILCECGWFGWLEEGLIRPFDVMVCPICGEPLLPSDFFGV